MPSSPRFKAHELLAGITGIVQRCSNQSLPGLSQQYGNLFRVSTPQSFIEFQQRVGSWQIDKSAAVPQTLGECCALVPCLNVHQFIVLLGAGFPILDWGYMFCTRPPYFFYIARAFAVLEGIGLSHSLGNCQAGRCSNGPLLLLAQATIRHTLWSTSACLQLNWVSLSLFCWFWGGTTISYSVVV